MRRQVSSIYMFAKSQINDTRDVSDIFSIRSQQVPDCEQMSYFSEVTSLHNYITKF